MRLRREHTGFFLTQSKLEIVYTTPHGEGVLDHSARQFHR